MDQPAPYVDRWRLGPRGQVWFDRSLVVLLLLPVPAYLVMSNGWALVVVGTLQVVPLWWRRDHPAAAFAVVALGSALQVIVTDQPLHTQLAFPVAVYTMARQLPARWGLAALGVGLVASAVAGVDWVLGFEDVDLGPSSFLPYFVSIATIVVTAWALGTLGRTRQAYVDALVERSDRIAREAAQQVELAAGAERARIAREMHDVVAHGLSVIVVQADGARYAAAQQPEVAAETLETIAATGRTSLAEMRRLLGLLRSGEVTGRSFDASRGRPQPRLDDLAVLVEEARTTTASVRAELPAPGTNVPDGVALTAYRVVQEALSNVRKHAGPAATASVVVTVADELLVTVEDDGRGASAPDDGHGLGLVGMRERVAVHAGVLEAGPRAGGGYRVHARIPR